jgi:RNA polymerase subunit RPABC4/transcription elongation factor Spt4
MKTKECPSCAMEVDSRSKVCPVCQYEFAETSTGMRWAVILVLILLLLSMFYFGRF